MSAPVIASVLFDKPVYNASDLITVTVTYTPGTSTPPPPPPETFNLSGTATDTASGDQAPFEGTFQVQAASVPVTDATTWVVSDTGDRTWTQLSDDGATAVFTATA